ncbi:MAG: hypothetical protein KGV59_01415 [Tenacibaculum sp.]|nr:hypothetical protein [Tenacibaculum sp.]
MKIINLNIPKEWNDLSELQLRQLALLFNSEKRGLFFDYRVLFILMDIRPWQFWKYRKLYKVIRNVKFSDLKEHYEWVYNEVGLTKFPYSIINYQLPIINTKKILPPADRLTNITIDEFAHCDDLFLGWHKTKDKEYLQYLCAVLYRKTDKQGKRITFDKHDLARRANAFKNVSLKKLLVVAMAYQGCKTYITKQYPRVFPKAHPTPTKERGQKLPNSSGFGKLILQLAGGKFGTYEETKRTNVYTFLSELSEQLSMNNKQ